MRIHVERTTGEREFRRACEMTLKPGQTSRVSFRRMLDAEHSPIRRVMYWIEMRGIPSFVAMHLVRHKQGVEPFVESNRDDRGGAGDGQVTRLTPVNVGLDLNAQALVNISRKRLCYNAHARTVAVWRKVRRALADVDPPMADAMVPECVMRGYCPELRECRPGAARVMAAYADTLPMRKRREFQDRTEDAE